jgi:hypothetical protein
VRQASTLPWGHYDGVRMMRRNNHSECILVFLGRKIPIVRPGAHGIAHAFAGIGRPIKPMMGAVGENCRQDGIEIPNPYIRMPYIEITILQEIALPF